MPKETLFPLLRPTLRATLLAATIGCTTESDSAAGRNGPLVRDSVGIEIVEYTLAMIDSLPLLETSDTFELSIGAVGGEAPYLFTFVVATALLSDGRIMILDNSDLEFRYYSAEGTFIGSVGRKGDGPGELRGWDGISIGSGDILRVWDGRTDRLLTITGPGQTVQETRISPAGRMGGRYLGTYDDGSHALWTSRLIGMATTRSVDHALRARLGRDSTWTVDSIVTLSTAEKAETHGESVWEWEPRNGFGFHPKGVWVWDAMVPQVSLVDHSGRVRRIVRWEQPDPTVSPEHERQYIEGRLERERPEAREALRLSLQKELIFPDSFPALAAVVASANGTGLIIRPVRAGDAAEPIMWTITPEGRLQSRIRAWQPRQPIQLDQDRVIAVEEDDDGVPRVRIRRLVPVRQ